jgi:hypothetical protein
MGDETVPTIIAVIVAIIGGLGGMAAILRVQSDNTNSLASGAKAVSEGAKNVVELMGERLDETEAQIAINSDRLAVLEAYVTSFDSWADRLLSILDRAITMLPDALRNQFESESNELKASRPKRSK